MEHQLSENGFNFNEHPHNRKNILTDEWILVSPQRSKRPWQGKVETIPSENRPTYDPDCYLCPGNPRAGGIVNTDYKGTFVFNNDFGALQEDIPKGEINNKNLLISKSVSGICRVICFTEKHNITLPEMELADIEKVIELWQKEFSDLVNNKNIANIQIFENKGEIMGCSNPHPHGQIWAQSTIPVEITKEVTQQETYFANKGKSLLGDYLELELKEKERIVFENDSFVVLVPFWATWPFETMIISKRKIADINQLTENEKKNFAESLKVLTIKYDNLFNISFPYSAGLHQAPVDGKDYPGWHLHMHFYPPLLRSATVKKFMVGYELLGNPQRDITPELAALRLRELSDIHYKSRH